MEQESGPSLWKETTSPSVVEVDGEFCSMLDNVAGMIDPEAAAPLEEDDPQDLDEGLLQSLAVELLRADSGLRMIYRFLNHLRLRFRLDDLVVVLDDERLGRQVFRASRAPFEGGWAEAVAVHSGPGLYGDPPLEVAPEKRRVITRICGMALELDITRGLSNRDALTGLLNRRGFEHAVRQAAEQGKRYGWPFSLVVIDLDGFKEINDRWGHATGDATLQSVAEGIEEALRTGDTAARIGGDEFALVVAGTDQEAIEALVERLRRRLAHAGPHGPIEFSHGSAQFPREATEVDEVFLLADRRLYADKAGARHP